MQPMWSNPNIHTSLSNTIRLQKVGRQSCRWNAGNYVVHTISLLYFKQADTTKQPTAIQTVTTQPMWCNPNINTYLFNSTGLHEGWKKFTQLEYGNECRCAPSHSFIFKQAVTTKQPASMQIGSIATMQPMWSNPNIHTSLSNTISLQKVGRQSCRWNAGNNGGSYHFTAILQAGRYNETTYRYSNCDNATHVV